MICKLLGRSIRTWLLPDSKSLSSIIETPPSSKRLFRPSWTTPASAQSPADEQRSDMTITTSLGTSSSKAVPLSEPTPTRDRTPTPTHVVPILSNQPAFVHQPSPVTPTRESNLGHEAALLGKALSMNKVTQANGKTRTSGQTRASGQTPVSGQTRTIERAPMFKATHEQIPTRKVTLAGDPTPVTEATWLRDSTL